MWGYVGRRLLQAVPVVFLSTVAVFALVRLLPGDTALVLAGPDGRPEVIAALRREFGLDRPLPEQYWIWITRAARLDLGTSALSAQPVTELIGRRIPASVELAIAAIVLEFTIAIATGTIAAMRRGRRLDTFISAWNSLALSVPGFWLAILGILLFAVTLRWLPAGGYVPLTTDIGANLRGLLMPAVTLALPGSAALSRLIRNSLLDVLGDEYIRTARAKGLRERTVLLRHALRNALLPVTTLLGLQFGRLLSGAVVIESVFTWPGVGRLMIDSIDSRDYLVVQGTLLLTVVTFTAVNLATDLSYVVFDPRIRLGRRGGAQ